MNARQIAEALSRRAHKEGSWWRAPCPAHRGRSDNSLAIRDNPKTGRPAVECHAGCRYIDVIKELRSRGLWPDSDQPIQSDHQHHHHEEPKPLPPGPATAPTGRWRSLA
jgi:hypothetical protein